MLTFGALMLVCGRLGDSIGHLTVFRAGLALSAVAFAIGTVAPDIQVLVLARIVQGAGAAACISCAPALATFLYPAHARMQALSNYAAIFAFAAAIGPAVGALLVEASGWRGVLAFRLPLLLAAYVLAPRLAMGSHTSKPFHAGPALMLTCAVALLLAAVASLQWPDARIVSLLAFGAGGLAIAVFSRLQRNLPEPFLPRIAFAAPHLLAINLLSVAAQAAAFAVLMLVPFALARRGLSIIPAGFVLATSSAATSLASQAAPALARTFGRGTLIPAGLLLCGAGLYAVSLWHPQTSLATCVFGLTLQGAGLGLFTVAYTDTVTGDLPPEDRGLAGGIVMATRTFGIVAGASLFSAIFRTHTEPASFAAGFALSLQWAAGLLLAASILLLPCYWGAKKG